MASPLARTSPAKIPHQSPSGPLCGPTPAGSRAARTVLRAPTVLTKPKITPAAAGASRRSRPAPGAAMRPAPGSGPGSALNHPHKE